MAIDTPIGLLPSASDLNLNGAGLSDQAGAKLFGFDQHGWRDEWASIGDYLDSYGPRMPAALKREKSRIAAAMGA